MVPQDGSWDSEALSIWLYIESRFTTIVQCFLRIHEEYIWDSKACTQKVELFDYILGFSFIGQSL